MVLAVLACFAVLGATVWSVLNRPTTRDRRRNTVTSAVLLGASGLIGAGALVAAFAGWL